MLLQKFKLHLQKVDHYCLKFSIIPTFNSNLILIRKIKLFSHFTAKILLSSIFVIIKPLQKDKVQPQQDYWITQKSWTPILWGGKISFMSTCVWTPHCRDNHPFLYFSSHGGTWFTVVNGAVGFGEGVPIAALPCTWWEPPRRLAQTWPLYVYCLATASNVPAMVSVVGGWKPSPQWASLHWRFDTTKGWVWWGYILSDHNF